jgi:hypothetical protein
MVWFSFSCAGRSGVWFGCGFELMLIGYGLNLV